MNRLRQVCRIWLYGAAISLYTYFIAAVSVAPFMGVVIWFKINDPDALDRVGVIVTVLGMLISPLIFGSLFYLVVGRRLKWHDLRCRRAGHPPGTDNAPTPLAPGRAGRAVGGGDVSGLR